MTTMTKAEIHERVLALRGKTYKGHKIFAVDHDEETDTTDLWTDGNPSRVSFAKAENAIAFVLMEEIIEIAEAQ